MIHAVATDPAKPGETFLPVRPYGLFVRVKSEPVGVPDSLKGLQDLTVVNSNDIRYKGVVEGVTSCGSWRESPLDFTLPKIDEDGFFQVGPTWYCICAVGMPDPWKPLSSSKYFFLNRDEVLKRILEHIFGTGYSSSGDGRRVSRNSPFANFFFGSTVGQACHVNPVRFQVMLLGRLVAHPWVRQVQESEIQREGWKDTVLLFPRQGQRGDGLLVAQHLYPPSFRKRLDPTSTSVSNTVNRVYHLCEGAKIVDGQIEPGISDFCAFTRRNSVYLRLTPKRAYLLRAAVMNSAELSCAQDRPIMAPGTVVQTRNLVTAIMELGHCTFEDAIAVAESAAQIFTAVDYTKVSRWSPQPITRFEVEKFSKVKPFDVLAKDVLAAPMDADLEGRDLGKTEDESFRTATIVASELQEEATLVDIQVAPQWYAGRFGFRTTFVFRSDLQLRDGDKITNFAGCKGVVRIVPDEFMPELPDGRKVQICVSPLSVAKRKCVSMLMEMGIGRAFEREEWEHTSAFGDEMPVPFTWVCANFGSKERLTFRGEKLPQGTYWGVLPWMRIAKSGIASRRCSGVGTKRPLTSEGLLPDDAGVSGQKIDTSKSITMISRGLKATLTSLMKSAPGDKMMFGMARALEGPAKDFVKDSRVYTGPQ